MTVAQILPPLLQGLQVTLQITLGGAAVAVFMAFVAGLGKLSRFLPVRWLAGAYVETFRGTSALVQLFWAYFVLPFFGLRLTAMEAGIVVLGLNAGAYGAEIVRGAVQAVAAGQRDAATALSFSRFQTMWHVLLPQAVVVMIPTFGNLFIELLKNTALVSLITLSELTFRGQLLRSATMQTTEIFGIVLLLYFAVALLINAAMRGLERTLTRGRAA